MVQDLSPSFWYQNYTHRSTHLCDFCRRRPAGALGAQGAVDTENYYAPTQFPRRSLSPFSLPNQKNINGMRRERQRMQSARGGHAKGMRREYDGEATGAQRQGDGKAKEMRRKCEGSAKGRQRRCGGSAKGMQRECGIEAQESRVEERIRRILRPNCPQGKPALH